MSWQPTATIERLRSRAALTDKVRRFFHHRGVMEVDTPLLAEYTVTCPHLESFEVSDSLANKTWYLQTSPEMAMKRLLAAGSGAIFQLGKAFRAQENGHKHNAEFTLLEWYRPKFDYHELQQEVFDLIDFVLGRQATSRLTYQEVFEKALGFSPFSVEVADLMKVAKKHELDVALTLEDKKDDWLDVLFSHLIEPELGWDGPCAIENYPVSQAVMAKTRVVDGVEVAERFEVYLHGMELANGFGELDNAETLLKRFNENNKERERLSKQEIAICERFIAAMKSGLGQCSGVALGFDRLLMIALKAKHIEEVVSFPFCTE